MPPLRKFLDFFIGNGALLCISRMFFKGSDVITPSEKNSLNTNRKAREGAMKAASGEGVIAPTESPSPYGSATEL